MVVTANWKVLSIADATRMGYAARSGGKDEVWAGTSSEKQLADYAVINTNRTEPVGGRKAHGIGLYDMNGNVWEWVEYCYGVPTKENICSRAPRGGSWSDNPENLRDSLWDSRRSVYQAALGFRLAQDNSE